MSDFATESGHWYTKSGEAAYTIVGANGNQRNTTVRDARKLGLVPSVTTVCSMEAKPQLTRWLVQQAMLAAITLPRMEGESDDQFMARANSDSQQQTRAAADRGTHLHGQIEQALRYGLGGMAAEDVAIVKPVIDWIESFSPNYTWHPERSFAHQMGYGGKIDLFGTNREGAAVVIDFKCKAGISNKQKQGDDLAYDQHITQLAAYANGLGHPDAKCVNLFIDAEVPGYIVAKDWAEDEINVGWEAFTCLLRLYQLRKGL